MIQETCACGDKYWPNQKWIHAKCLVVNAPKEAVVNKRSKDRHKKTPERAQYQLEHMRRKRGH